MGTRNLTMVISGAETKVAQYGQWDGYPSGQGATALLFLLKADLGKLKQHADKCKWISDNECEELEKTFDNETKFYKEYPQFTRDTAAEILKYVYNCEKEEIPMVDSSSFAADSLFCEWAYVIDLDKQTFEVYEGFNQSPLPETDRFSKMQKAEDSKYYPVRHVKTYSLLDLPTEDSFIADLTPVEEDSE